jgi:GH15 family glucan-1,4-alpha-glucosidase
VVADDHPYQPIENYGVIGDQHTVALVGVDGSIDFCCFPRCDSPTIFAALLDARRGGRFAIRPAQAEITHHQLYLRCRTSCPSGSSPTTTPGCWCGA